MKQHITEEQWEELSEEQRGKLWGSVDLPSLSSDSILESLEASERPSIGQMIEFLGEDLTHYTKMVTFMDDTANWAVEKVLEEIPKYAISVRSWEYLTDALWEACKNKLNQTKDE